MTKLMQWLFFGVLFLSFWLSLVTKTINFYVLEEHPKVVLFLPAILIVLFGIYATFVVLWRVYTFNDCENAALELKRTDQTEMEELNYKQYRKAQQSKTLLQKCSQVQIKEARADLKARGFRFKEEKT